MILICQIYNDFKGVVNTWQKGHFRPQSFEFALYEASIEIFNEARKEWEKSQIISDVLRPYFHTVQVAVKDFPKGSMIPYPKDYCSFSSLRFFSKKEKGKPVLCAGINIMDKDTEKEKSCRPLREEEKASAIEMDRLIENDIDKIDNQRWGAFCSDEFIVPDISNPGCTQYNDGFKVLPKLGYVVLDYLANPERPVFAYRRDEKDNIICIPEKCTNLLWGPEVLPELMSRLKKKYASYTGNQQKYLEGQKETEILS